MSFGCHKRRFERERIGLQVSMEPTAPWTDCTSTETGARTRLLCFPSMIN